ncbi:hypothetical protein [Nocardia farcinica]|uniref:Uncharacterized protein n=1 Tax=Nocardia farcinica TaxID=37329 RepID=A0A0H5NBN1_NOCFR|nr:hypothetical protein [Nocardia farcinica]AXK88663.1 hypothetical protein DXT66_26290 [Nocardia farcinica]MBF6139708.1 hypothetical protein [Nocardia farcinica]MBF6291691.1 hypothetical protein [Nocardia farcinica]MBF6378019.1 hypothetical protein [Nocardia farcinica]MBF6417297.1 hypothetical protein [Nocardia farcinica]
MNAGADTGLRELLGLHGRSAWYFLAILQATLGLYSVHNFGTVRPLPTLVALVLIAAAGAVVVLVEDEPLPWRATWFVLVAAIAATTLTRLFPRPDREVTPATVFAASYVLAMLVLRGRLGAAWGGVAGLALAVAAADLAGVESVFSAADVPTLTVAAVTVGVAVMRPTQRSLRVLREEATMRAAAEATMAAENAERDRQLAELDEKARPMLERIAAGADLDAAEREQCRLLEAGLRDRLRAPQLVTEELSAAAWQARARGADVVLLDDGGFTGVPATVRDQVIRTAVEELNTVDAAAVTVRVLPPGRRALATILVDGPTASRRTEIDPTGRITVTA